MILVQVIEWSDRSPEVGIDSLAFFFFAAAATE
jgi:hypothetical protein